MGDSLFLPDLTHSKAEKPRLVSALKKHIPVLETTGITRECLGNKVLPALACPKLKW
jgi:hypothetical protein